MLDKYPTTCYTCIYKEGKMTRKEQNKITRETHERVEIYDWALDLDINEDFGQWLEELSEDNY